MPHNQVIRNNRQCLHAVIAWFSIDIKSVYTIQPVVTPVVQPVWQPVGCLYTRYNLLSNRLSNRFDNRFDNRLYRVNGVWIMRSSVNVN